MSLPAKTALALLVVVVAACSPFTVRKPTPPAANLDPPPVRTVSISGTLDCVPLRDLEAAVAGECPAGLRDAAGRIYRLREFDPAAPKLTGMATGAVVLIAGTIAPLQDPRFAAAGDVWVLAISTLAP